MVDESETLGSYLKTQRESKKISLREVAKNTRVREPILKAIEEDQHDLLPPPTYVKGFLLAYAKYLRLDPNDVFLRYERVLKGEPVTPPPPSSPKPKQKIASIQSPKPKQKISPAHPQKPKQKILWNTKQIWMVGGVIVASLIVFYFFFPYSFEPPVEPVIEKPVPEKPVTEEKLPIATSPPVAATTSAPPAPSPPMTATPTVADKKPFSLQIKAVEETWVNLQVDDQSAKEMTFRPGEWISVQASNQIRIMIGNAGGLDLALNGKPLEKLGKSGEVLTLLFTSQGVEMKRHEKPKPP